MVEFGVDFIGDFVLVVVFEVWNCIFVVWIIWCDDYDIFEVFVLYGFVDGFVEVVILLGDVEKEGIVLFIGVLWRVGVGWNVEGFVVEYCWVDGEYDVGEDNVGYEIDFVFF